MALSQEQLGILAADMAMHSEFDGLPQNADGADVIKTAYNQVAVPDFWVWRTSLAEQEVYERVVDGLKWNWATFKAQTVQDRDSWQTMWHPGQVNPSLGQTRDGWLAIFGGQGASQQQVNYLLALGRRPATAAEHLFATGVGSPASPAVLTFEGDITVSDVEQAWAL